MEILDCINSSLEMLEAETGLMKTARARILAVVGDYADARNEDALPKVVNAADNVTQFPARDLSDGDFDDMYALVTESQRLIARMAELGIGQRQCVLGKIAGFFGGKYVGIEDNLRLTVHLVDLSPINRQKVVAKIESFEGAAS